MTSHFRIGVIGCGMVSQFLGWTCRLNRKLKIIHCCDSDPVKAEAFGRRFNVLKVSHGYHEVLSDNNVDAVYVAVPHFLHYPILLECIDRGLPVLCEKPATLTFAEARDVSEKAKAKQVKIGINYQFRYDTGCYNLVQSCQLGQLGTLYHTDCRTSIYRRQDYFDKGPWRGRLKESGGGALFIHGTHALDIALWAFQSKPILAQGSLKNIVHKSIEVEDFGKGVVQLENSTLIRLQSSLIEKGEPPLSIEVHGELGRISYKGFVLSKLKYHGISPHRVAPPVRGLHAFTRSIEAFRQWIEMDIPYLSPIEESLPILATIEAIYGSAKSGKVEMVRGL